MRNYTSLASFDHHMKRKNFGLCLMKYVQVEQIRKVLQSKQRDLKRKGKYNKPNASAAVSKEDTQVLHEKDLLGSSTAEARLNTVWFNRAQSILGYEAQGAQRKVLWKSKTLSNFHRAGVPRIHRTRNVAKSFRKRSSEYKSHCTENVCCAQQQEMSSKGLQSLRRKATRGNENRRCTVLLGSKQCKIWPQQTLLNKVTK